MIKYLKLQAAKLFGYKIAAVWSFRKKDQSLHYSFTYAGALEWVSCYPENIVKRVVITQRGKMVGIRL